MNHLQPPAMRTRTPTLSGDSHVSSICRAYGMRWQPRFASPVFNTVCSMSDDKKVPVACRPPLAIASDLRVGLLAESPLKFQARSSEQQIEKVIYGCRFFTLLGVSGSLVGSLLCFIKGSVYIASSFMEYVVCRGKVISMLIEAIDVYLLGTVMLVFGMGLYELFISNLDIAKTSANRSSLFGLFMLQERPQWLEIKSINELKTKLGHVIVMILLVGLFEKSNKVMISTPKDLLCFAASILLSSCGLYLLSKLKH